MADEQDRWLDRDAAERLLRGEPLDAVDADTHARAKQLAEALAALAVTPPPTSEKLPGEEAAVAAFRAARTAGQDSEAALRPDRAALSRALDVARTGGNRNADAGLIRLGRPGADVRRTRWGRPARFALAAVVTAGMIGGVAVAAGTGMLPTPFRHEPAPAASVSAAVTPPQPLRTPTPGAGRTGGSPSPTPGGTTGGSARGGSSHDEAGVGSAATGIPGSAGDHAEGRTDEWWGAVRSSCRDMADGKVIGAERLRDLSDAAGGSGRVKWFCKGVLAGGDRTAGGSGQGSGQDGNGKGHLGKGNGNGHGGGNGGEGDQGGDGNGGDGEGHRAPGGTGVAFTPTDAPRALTLTLPRPTASPSPAYSALNTADDR